MRQRSVNEVYIAPLLLLYASCYLIGSPDRSEDLNVDLPKGALARFYLDEQHENAQHATALAVAS